MLEKIKQGRVTGGMTASQILRNNWQGLGSKDNVEGCLGRLVARGWAKVIEESTGGRPAKK